MIRCPVCNNSYRVLTSRPISSEIREYCCDCTHCGSRFRQYGVFEGYIVENKKSQPPSPELQPKLALKREKLLRILTPVMPTVRQPERQKMVFKQT